MQGRDISIVLLGFWLALALPAQSTWYRTYGGGDFDKGYSLVQNWDSTIVVAGSGTGQNSDVLWMQVDSLGELMEWKLIGWGGMEWAESIKIFPADSGFVMVGTTNSIGAGSFDVLLIRLNSQGDTLWARTFGGPYWDIGKDLIISPTGTIWVLAQTYSGAESLGAIWLLEVDSSGNLLSERTVQETAELSPRHLQITSDSALLITSGISPGPYGAEDSYLLKTNLQGQTLWQRIFGSSGIDIANNTAPYVSGSLAASYLLSGEFKPNADATGRIFLQRISLDGDSILRVNFDGLPEITEVSRENVHSIYLNVNGVYGVFARVLIPGLDVWDYEFMETSFLFYVDGTRTSQSGNQLLMQACLLWDGGFSGTGETDLFGPGQRAVFISRMQSDGRTAGSVTVNLEEISSQDILIYPNPVQRFLRVQTGVDVAFRYRVLDIQGRICVEGESEISDVTIEVGGLSNGVYFLELIQGDLVRYFKVVKSGS